MFQTSAALCYDYYKTEPQTDRPQLLLTVASVALIYYK